MLSEPLTPRLSVPTGSGLPGGREPSNAKGLIKSVWLPTLRTDTPQAGFELAVKLSRVGVKVTQHSDEIRTQLRPAYDHDTAQLIASSHVIVLDFQTVAAANNWWGERYAACGAAYPLPRDRLVASMSTWPSGPITAP